jgi:hypothetical protein
MRLTNRRKKESIPKEMKKGKPIKLLKELR